MLASSASQPILHEAPLLLARALRRLRRDAMLMLHTNEHAAGHGHHQCCPEHQTSTAPSITHARAICKGLSFVAGVLTFAACTTDMAQTHAAPSHHADHDLRFGRIARLPCQRHHCSTSAHGRGEAQQRGVCVRHVRCLVVCGILTSFRRSPVHAGHTLPRICFMHILPRFSLHVSPPLFFACVTLYAGLPNST